MIAKFLVPLLVIGLVLFFFKRKKSDEKVEKEAEAAAPTAVEMRQDSVCGLYVEETTKHKVKYYDKIYYFCSDDCKNKFIELKKSENQG